MLPILLAAAAVAAPPSRAPRAPAAPFADCVRLAPSELSPRSKMEGVECRTRQVEVVSLPLDGQPVEAIQDQFVAGLGSSLGPVTLSDPTFADGRATRALEVRGGSEGGVTMRGTLVWDRPSAGAVKGVVCFWTARVDGAAFCEEAVPRVLKSGIPSDVPAAPPRDVPRLVGRPLTVPAGCQAAGDDNGGTIRCGVAEGMLGWALVYPAPTDADLDALPAQFAAQIGADLADPSWSTLRRSCTMEGEPAQACWEVRQVVDGPEKLRHGLLTVGKAAGLEVSSMCLWRGPGDGVPALCTQVVDVVAP